MDNYPQFEAGQKTREIAAQKAGFGNAETYRQAKTVVQNASAELKAQGERRGRPKQGGEDIPVNSPELTGQETREIAAQKAGSVIRTPTGRLKP